MIGFLYVFMCRFTPLLVVVLRRRKKPQLLMKLGSLSLQERSLFSKVKVMSTKVIILWLFNRLLCFFDSLLQWSNTLVCLGLEDQGLYRLVGVSSKVNKLLTLGLDPAKSEKLVLEDPTEWEVKTITSALKQYFRNLPEPLMTYKLHSTFIGAASKQFFLLWVRWIYFLYP